MNKKKKPDLNEEPLLTFLQRTKDGDYTTYLPDQGEYKDTQEKRIADMKTEENFYYSIR